MTNFQGKTVYFNYKFHFGKQTEVEIDVFGESLFTYYVGWELQNLIKINGWANKESQKKLIEQRGEGSDYYKCHHLRIENRSFYFIAPPFFEVFVRSIDEESKMKVVFIHSRVQKFTRVLSEPSHFLEAPEKCSFSIGKVYHTRDNDMAFAIINRNGRTFTIIKGVLDLAIFCCRGVESWLTTYKVKKNAKKEIKKEN